MSKKQHTKWTLEPNRPPALTKAVTDRIVNGMLHTLSWQGAAAMGGISHKNLQRYRATALTAEDKSSRSAHEQRCVDLYAALHKALCQREGDLLAGIREINRVDPKINRRHTCIETMRWTDADGVERIKTDKWEDDKPSFRALHDELRLVQTKLDQLHRKR